MRMLETNDWLIISNIIYKIHAIDNFDEMRQELLIQLKLLIDYDSADFVLVTNEEGNLVDSAVTYNYDISLSEKFRNVDYNREIITRGKTLIYIETDVISDEERVKTDYYKNVYKPNNLHYALRMVIVKQEKLLGILSFYRTIGKENFNYNDIIMLEILKEHLTYRIEKHLSEIETFTEKLSITETIEKYGLSEREATVLKELMAGKDNNTICEELFITTNTIKKHILNIYRKLGIKNRVQLFKMVRERE